MKLKPDQSQNQSVNQNDSQFYSQLDESIKGTIVEENIANQTMEAFVDQLIQEKKDLDLQQKSILDSQIEQKQLKCDQSITSFNPSPVQSSSLEESKSKERQPHHKEESEVKEKKSIVVVCGGKSPKSQKSEQQDQQFLNQNSSSQIDQQEKQNNHMTGIMVYNKQENNVLKISQDIHKPLHSPDKLQQQQEPDESILSGPITIETKQIPLIELQKKLKMLLAQVEKLMPKSFEMLCGHDLQSDLAKCQNEKEIDDELYLKVENYIQETEKKLLQNKQKKHNFSMKDLVQKSIKQNTRNQTNQQQRHNTEQTPISPQSCQLSEPKEQSIASNSKFSRCPSPTPSATNLKKFNRLPLYLKELSQDENSKYQGLVTNFESTLAQINAKDIFKLRNLSGKGAELGIAFQILYFIAEIDSSIVLSNDKKTLQATTWEGLRKILSNGGNIVNSLKKLKDYIDNDLVSNAHFQQILLHHEANIGKPIEEPPLNQITNFLNQAILLTKFVKHAKGIAEEQYKTPSAKKQINRKHLSPERFVLTQNKIADQQSPICENLQLYYQTQPRSRLQNLKAAIGSSKMSGRLSNCSDHSQNQVKTMKKSQSGFKLEVNSKLFQKETDHLLLSAIQREEIKKKRDEIQSRERSIKKLKFEIDREDRKRLREEEKKSELLELQYQRELAERKQKIENQKLKKLKEEQLLNTLAEASDRNAIQEAKRLESQRKLMELQKNMIARNEQKLKQEQIKHKLPMKEQLQNQNKVKNEDFSQATKSLTSSTIQDKEAMLREQYIQQQKELQEKREEQRRIQIQTELELLKKKEKELNDEIELLNKLKTSGQKGGLQQM